MAKSKKTALPEASTPVVTPPVIKLDLGCGKNKQQGFLGVDRRKFDGVDFTTDLTSATWFFDNDVGNCTFVEGSGWKLNDSSVTEAHCSHFLEHLNHNEEDPARVRFLNEVYRVLIPGGKISIITPYWASNRAYGDFTHADKPVSEMFYYYVSKAWREVNAPDNDIEWNPKGYSCDFDATWGYSMHPEIMAKNQQAQTFALTFYKEAAQDLHASLTAKK
jgi:ubiquinone/menaquinone biosynthesis C-methylase UbiE